MILRYYCLILLELFSFAYGYSGRKIRIGAIFHEYNSEIETAFRIALQRENMENSKLEFIPEVRNIDQKDSFGAEKTACELASVGVVAIFGPNTVQTSRIVGSVCNQLGIPHIISHWRPANVKDSNEQHFYTRNFFPDSTIYSKALAKIVEDYNWKGFTLLYDNYESLEKLEELLEVHNVGDSPITMRQLPEDEEDYQLLLKSMENRQEYRFVIDCNPEKIPKIFKEALGVKLMGDYQSYFITSLDFHMYDLNDLPHFLANITTIRLMDPWSEEVRNAVFDWQESEQRNKRIRGIDGNRTRTETALFYDAVKTFLISFRESNAVRSISAEQLYCNQQSKWEYGEKLIENLNQKTNKGMTGRILFSDEGVRTDFYMEVLEVNKTGVNRIAIVEPPSMKIVPTRTSEQVHQQVTESLQNKTVSVASILVVPFLMLKPEVEGVYYEGNAKYEGYTVDLIEAIAKSIGFTYKLEVIKGKQGSYNQKTKQWDGLVKHILDRVGGFP